MLYLNRASSYQPPGKTWCAEIKKRFYFNHTHCSSVRYANFDAYFVVEVVEKGDEHRIHFRTNPTQVIAFESHEIVLLFQKLEKRQWELFEQGNPPTETSDQGYLDYSDPQMHQHVVDLIKLVPSHRDNLLQILAKDKDVTNRANAAHMLNWTVHDLEVTVSQSAALLDDPNSLVRNNISRFTLHFIEKIQSPQKREALVDQFLIQLDRPSHGDRNQAVYNLYILAQKFQQSRNYIKQSGLTLIKSIAENSVLSNVRDPAQALLQLIEKPVGKPD